MHMHRHSCIHRLMLTLRYQGMFQIGSVESNVFKSFRYIHYKHALVRSCVRSSARAHIRAHKLCTHVHLDIRMYPHLSAHIYISAHLFACSPSVRVQRVSDQQNCLEHEMQTSAALDEDERVFSFFNQRNQLVLIKCR